MNAVPDVLAESGGPRDQVDPGIPLCVDIDGTLLLTDLLYETLVDLLRTKPWQAALLPFWLLRGRAFLKAELSARTQIDPALLPYRADLVRYIEAERGRGRRIVAVSAANERSVAAIATHLGIFDEMLCSDSKRNLKGATKAGVLAAHLPQGFSYAGNGPEDLPVWQTANALVLAGVSPSVARRAIRLGKPVETEFRNAPAGLRSWIKQFRVHQWSKNLLVFLPLLLAHHFNDVHAWAMVALAFVGMCLIASATYVLNDLLDLPADRRHATKSRRPLASGTIPIAFTLVAAPLMLVAGFGLALASGWLTGVAVLCYLALTLAYSYWLKKLAMFDIVALGLMFTSRLLIGCAAAELSVSPWLLAFSFALFFSLSTAKRHTEIVKKARAATDAAIPGRGYDVNDIPLTLTYGVASGVASLVILMLYTTNGVAQNLYRNANWLWAIPLLLHIWQTRIWLLAHRGQLDDDPIVFALKDPVSLLLGLGCVIAFYLAL